MEERALGPEAQGSQTELRRPVALHSAGSEPTIAQIIAPIQDELARTDAFLGESLRSRNAYIENLTRHIERFKGKRLRPALVHLAAQAVQPGAQSPGSSDAGPGTLDSGINVQVAAVIELIHLTTLVHDDIIDEARIRRRVPTVNAAWNSESAVMLGDYLFATAFEILTSMTDLRPLAILAATTKLMCEGELAQIGHRNNVHLDETQYLEVIGKKTAALFRAAGYLGALLGGAAPEQAEALGRYGRNLGVAFQIVDDCLDLVGTEAQMGKSLGTDVKKGKMTLPVIHWLERLPADRRGQAAAELGLLARGDSQGAGREPDAPTAPSRPREASLNRATLARRLQETRSLAYAQDRAREHVEAARRELPDLPASPARESLYRLGDYVIARSV